MATDLSELAANSLWPTSQISGGRPADPSAAMTAPGTASLGSDLADTDVQPFVRPVADDGQDDDAGLIAPSAARLPGPPKWTRAGG